MARGWAAAVGRRLRAVPVPVSVWLPTDPSSGGAWSCSESYFLLRAEQGSVGGAPNITTSDGLTLHACNSAASARWNHGIVDALEPGIPWLERGERQRSRERRIDCVAAGIEPRDAGLRGALCLRHHHAAAA